MDTGLYKDIFEYAATPAAVFDSAGKSVLANRSLRIQLGYDLEKKPIQLIHFHDIFENKEDGDNFRALLHKRQVLRRWETRLDAKKRGGFSVLMSGRTFDFQGEEYFQISFTDISHQKDLDRTIRKENARLISLMENLSAGLFFVNHNGILTTLNNALGEMLGTDEEKLVSLPYQALFSKILDKASEPEILQPQLSSAVSNLNQYPKVGFTLEDELAFHYELVFFPARDKDGFSVGWGGLVQDVTEMKQQSEWKLELLSILSHDIRSPLATLKGHVGVLRENFQNWGSEMAEEFLNVIERSVNKLSQQVDRNLALTRVEGGELGLRPQSVDASQMIQQFVEQIGETFTDVKIELDAADFLPKIRVDQARIEEVLINLLDNAIRYNPPDKNIEISVKAKDHWLVFSILDYGKGIPTEQQPTIFDKYVREVEDGGTGLGLYISRKIVEAHGGQIRVQSPPPGLDCGTEIIFTLPAAYAPIGNDAVQEPVHHPAKNRGNDARILIVEDEFDFQALLRTILTEEGYQIEMVSNGPAALDILQNSTPDVILLDWMLPGMNGLAICRNIRRWSNVPIIVITSCTEQKELITALDAGADDYIIKPFDRKELLARIRTTLRRGESGQGGGKPNRFTARGLLIDFDTQEVWMSGKHIELTPTEYEILEYMARHPRQLLTYDQLLQSINVFQGETNREVLFVHISRLRKKLEPDPKNPTIIVTKWGYGYVFMQK